MNLFTLARGPAKDHAIQKRLAYASVTRPRGGVDQVAHTFACGRPRDNSPALNHECEVHFAGRRRSWPLISGGCSSSSIAISVGATSASVPLSFMLPLKDGSKRISGTELVVCAVCGCPVAGSAMNSALP